MATYRLTSGEGVIHTPNGAFIPADTRNVDWRVYQAWLALGNVPDPYVPPALPTAVEVIDAAFPQTGTARVLFEVLFELANGIRVLEGLPPITRAQAKTWLIAKLPT